MPGFGIKHAAGQAFRFGKGMRLIPDPANPGRYRMAEERWYHRILDKLHNACMRISRRDRVIVVGIDRDSGLLTMGILRWSWLRWRWERWA